LLTFDEVAECGEKEQSPGKNPAGGETKRVVATGVVAFMSKNGVEGVVIENGDRAGGKVDPRPEQPRAERARGCRSAKIKI
jgi:hypothetical protein